MILWSLTQVNSVYKLSITCSGTQFVGLKFFKSIAFTVRNKIVCSILYQKLLPLVFIVFCIDQKFLSFPKRCDHFFLSVISVQASPFQF